MKGRKCLWCFWCQPKCSRDTLQGFFLARGLSLKLQASKIIILTWQFAMIWFEAGVMHMTRHLLCFVRFWICQFNPFFQCCFTGIGAIMRMCKTSVDWSMAWFNREQLYNYNKTKHSTALCIFNGIYYMPLRTSSNSAMSIPIYMGFYIKWYANYLRNGRSKSETSVCCEYEILQQ